MTESDRKGFMALMVGLGESFGEAVSPQRIEIYFRVLSEFPLADVERAAGGAISESKGFPRPVDIISRLRAPQGVRVTEAWYEFLNAREQFCACSVEFEDRAIHSVVERMGGWMLLCQFSDRDMDFRQKDFENLYRAYSQRPDAAHSDHLIGETERDNTGKGYPASLYRRIRYVAAGPIFAALPEGPKPSGPRLVPKDATVSDAIPEGAIKEMPPERRKPR